MDADKLRGLKSELDMAAFDAKFRPDSSSAADKVSQATEWRAQ